MRCHRGVAVLRDQGTLSPGDALQGPLGPGQGGVDGGDPGTERDVVRVEDAGRAVYGVVADAVAYSDLATPLHAVIGAEGDPAAVDLEPTRRAEIRLFTASVLRQIPEEPLQPVPLGPVWLASDEDVLLALRMDAYARQGRAVPYGDLAVHLGFVVAADHQYAQYLLKQLRATARGGRRPLGYFILEQAFARPTQLLEALEWQTQLGGRIGEIMIQNGWLTEAQVGTCLDLQQASTTSLSAFATPAATAPMPDWLTSLVWMRAFGFARFRSKISCLRSSIE